MARKSLSFVVFGFFILFAATARSQQLDGEDIVLLDRFERLFISGQDSPPDHIDDGWQPTTLKDVWYLKRRTQHTEAWYRTDFALAQARTDLAIFIPRVNANASVWLNGVELGNTGSFSDPLPNNWNFPVFLTLPQQLLNEENNHLSIRLKVNPSQTGFLFEVYVGKRSILEQRYNQSYFLKVTAIKILSAVMAICVVILLVFYFTISLPRSYLWFALATLGWIVFSGFFFVKTPLIFSSHWDSVASIALFASTLLYTKCALSIFAISRPKLEKLLLILLGGQVIATFVLPVVWLNVLHVASLLTSVITLLLLAMTLGIRSIRQNRKERFWFVFTSISIVFLLVYDLIFLVAGWTSEFAKFVYVPLVAIIGGTSVFIRKLIASHHEHQMTRMRHLELVGAARSEAVVNERKRLMQEIHDGVGGQLLSTLTRLQKNAVTGPEVIDELRASIDDLRMIVHSLESVSQQHDINTILATMRERMEPGLRKQGIRIEWRVRPVPSVENFDSDHALHLMRILQESMANIVKHAGASCITIGCDIHTLEQRPGIMISVGDNGRGFETRRRTVGVGLKNMQDRATKLQGRIFVESGREGTIVHLWIPAGMDTSSTRGQRVLTKQPEK